MQYRDVSQLADGMTWDHVAGSSNLSISTKGRYTVIGSGPDCKSGGFGFWEFKSLPAHFVPIAERNRRCAKNARHPKGHSQFESEWGYAFQGRHGIVGFPWNYGGMTVIGKPRTIRVYGFRVRLPIPLLDRNVTDKRPLGKKRRRTGYNP